MEKIKIVRSFKRFSVSIQIEPDLSIKVAVPAFFSHAQINKLLEEKKEWIQNSQEKMRTRNPHTTGYLYLGKRYQLATRLTQKNIIELEDKIYVASNNEKFIKNYLLTWYKQQARKVIVERVARYAQALNLHYNSVNLTSATTRWGSCSSQKNLNFNWKLIMAPLAAIDYVVAHELAHLVEMNHSPIFWETVRKMFPIYREYRTWFKRHGHTLTMQ